MWRLLGIAAVAAASLVTAPGSSRAQSAAGDPSSDGAQLFAASCGFCHQDGGRAAGRGPKLAGTDRPEEYLLQRIRIGKEGAMPAYGRAFSESQLRALVAYIRSLKDDGR
jgi:mono/diheme cytochrome c family protein